MDRRLRKILEELDIKLADIIDRFEEITPDLKKDADAFIADDVRELAEDIKGGMELSGNNRIVIYE